MNFLNKKELKKNNIFLRKGYIVSKVENKSSLRYISSLIFKALKKQIDNKYFKNLNKIHKEITIEEPVKIIFHPMNQFIDVNVLESPHIIYEILEYWFSSKYS